VNCDGKNPSNRFSYWNPDAEQFWEEKGRPVAMRNLVVSIHNLVVSIHNLLCGFTGGWAVAGLAGATLRVPKWLP
jgi:hypothetical protein